MPLRFTPAPRTLLLCDYSLGGFVAPEMVKRRPAIVIAGRLHSREGLATVVPLSTTPPIRPVPYVVELRLPFALPAPFDAPVMFAKCDMLATVCLARLDLFRDGRDATGGRKYITPRLNDDMFHLVVSGIRSALGI